MRRLDRHTLVETSIPMLVTLAVTTFLLFTTQILRIGEAAFGRGLTAGDFVLVLALLIPRFLVFTLPVAVLVGVVSGLGKMSDDREVLALEAAGVSPAGLWRGPLILACAAALLCAWLTLWAEPYSLRTLADRLAEVVQRNLVLGIAPGEIHEEVPDTVLYARGRAEDGTLEDVLIRLRQGERTGTITARRARLQPHPPSTLTLEVEDGEIAIAAQAAGEEASLTRTRFQTGVVGLDVTRTVARRVRFIGALDVLGQEALAAHVEQSEGGERRKAASLYHRRLALPFGCIALAFLAFPLGLRVPRAQGGGRGPSVVFAVLALGFYFVAGRLTEAMALSGTLPVEVAPWLPSAALLLLGLFLLRRRQRT
ncbi:MAG: LptF/LptG family permease [Deltaproteobacteria bacterium]|nr:LptF/LptG family permease [Deltaproteobacteria bacterium]